MNQTLYRYRLRFAKTEAMRFTGHLDLHRAWERALRRARLPLAYSSGFHPHPRIEIGAALPLGIIGDRELLEFRLDAEHPAEKILSAIQAVAPPGISPLALSRRADGSPSLGAEIAAGEYLADPIEGAWPPDLEARTAALLALVSLLRERRGKTYDLRPLIFSLDVADDALRMRLQLAPAATGRPEEVLAALELEDPPARIRRTHLLARSSDGGFLPLDS